MFGCTNMQGATWSQVGADINGRTANSWFGWSVDINAAGDKIVASAPYDYGQAGVYFCL